MLSPANCFLLIQINSNFFTFNVRDLFLVITCTALATLAAFIASSFLSMVQINKFVKPFRKFRFETWRTFSCFRLIFCFISIVFSLFLFQSFHFFTTFPMFYGSLWNKKKCATQEIPPKLIISSYHVHAKHSLKQNGPHELNNYSGSRDAPMVEMACSSTKLWGTSGIYFRATVIFYCISMI